MSFSDTGVIAGDWNPSTGVLTLAGADTVANYQAALRGVSYSNTSDDPVTDTRTIEISVTDAGQVTSEIVQRTLQVGAVNDEPAGADKTITTLEDSSYVFAVGDFGFSDSLDNHSLNALVISSVPDSGFLLLDSTPLFTGDRVSIADIESGRLIYMSASDVNGPNAAGFDFQVQDDGGTINSGIDTDTTANRITIDLTSVNDAPAGNDTLLTGLEDTDITLGLSDFGYSDTDANNFEAVIIDSIPAGGQLLLAGASIAVGDVVQVDDIVAGNLVYQPDTNFYGAVDFEFRVRDDGGILHGGTDTSVIANTAEIDIAQVSDSPIGGNNVIAVTEDIQHTFALSEFPFTDVEGDLLAGITINSLPESGTLFLSGSPVVAGDFIPATQIDTGDFVYVPTSDSASFDFQVSDNGSTSNGGMTTDVNVSRIDFDFISINDAPQIVTSTASVDEGAELIITEEFLSAIDPDDQSQALTFTLQNLPLNGTLNVSGTELNTGDSFSLADIFASRVSYEHDGSETSSDSIDFSLADGGEDGALPALGQLPLLIREVIDQAPQIDNDELVLEVGGEFDSVAGDLLVSGDNVLGGDLLPQNPGFTLEIETEPEQGTLTLLPNGAFVYEHNGSLILQDQFSYRITNDDGVFTIATVDILIEPPFAAAAAVPEISPNLNPAPAVENVDSSEDSNELEVETVEEEPEMEEESEMALVGESSIPEFDASAAAVFEGEEDNLLRELGVSNAGFENNTSQAIRTELLLAALEVVQHNSLQSSEFENVGTNLQLQRIDVEFVASEEKRVGITNSNFLRALKQVDSDLQEAESEDTLKIQISSEAVFGVSISATAGILAWALRGGALLASVMAATPIWSAIDPVRVFNANEAKKGDAEASEVEKIFD